MSDREMEDAAAIKRIIATSRCTSITLLDVIDKHLKFLESYIAKAKGIEGYNFKDDVCPFVGIYLVLQSYSERIKNGQVINNSK